VWRTFNTLESGWVRGRWARFGVIQEALLVMLVYGVRGFDCVLEVEVLYGLCSALRWLPVVSVMRFRQLSAAPEHDGTNQYS
jgi:hypothetical protein